MFRSRAHSQMASTRGGLRRILRRHDPTADFIAHSVKAGTFRTSDELARVRKERLESADDLATVMRRFRQDIVRGSAIQDYPIEYQILQRHPPVPDPPRTPRKLQNTIDRLEREANMKKQQGKNVQSDEQIIQYVLQKELRRNNPNAAASAHRRTGGSQQQQQEYASSPEYYAKLFGAHSNNNNNDTSHTSGLTHLSRKSARVQQAYAKALQTLQVVRTQNGTQQNDTAADTQISTDEALARVDELIQQDQRREWDTARERVRAAHQWRNHSSNSSSSNSHTPIHEMVHPAVDAYIASQQGQKTSKKDKNNKEEDTEAATSDDHNDTDLHNLSVFEARPTAVQGLVTWSERLQQVPYHQWTVGASTALDHWIARVLLRVGEETWQQLLEGEVYNDSDIDSDAQRLLELGRQVVAMRETVFPETMGSTAVAQDDDANDNIAAATASNESKDLADKTIEELLAGLGGLQTNIDDDNDKKSSGWDWAQDSDDTTTSQEDTEMAQLVDELQTWRAKQMDQAYEQWEPSDQEACDTFVRRLVHRQQYNHNHRQHSGKASAVDYTATRQALLAVPPVSRDESHEFWSRIQQRGQAEALLDTLLPTKKGIPDHMPPAAVPWLHRAFLELPRQEQLDCFEHLGALQPLLDEYTRESDRTRFLRRYAPVLMRGIALEHLVEDPEGPIGLADLRESILLVGGKHDELSKLPTTARFALVPRAYGSSSSNNNNNAGGPDNDDSDERARAVFQAWNTFKAGRARYEEKLFQTGRLGLRYTDEIDNPENNK